MLLVIRDTVVFIFIISCTYALKQMVHNYFYQISSYGWLIECEFIGKSAHTLTQICNIYTDNAVSDVIIYILDYY